MYISSTLKGSSFSFSILKYSMVTNFPSKSMTSKLLRKYLLTYDILLNRKLVN